MDPKIRDICLFVAGAGVMAHQTLFAVSPSGVLVGAALSMMIGGPIYRLLSKADQPPGGTQ
jgi:high-affinity Fe2+/Pb2+ permease